MKPEYVGNSHDGRPQVFNREYIVDGTCSRRRGALNTKKPWFVGGGKIPDKKFRTHAKAIAYADKIARNDIKP